MLNSISIRNRNFQTFYQFTLNFHQMMKKKLKKSQILLIKILIFSPRGIREMLKLNNPIYEKTSAYGHFVENTNKGEFTWEKTDKVNLFKL